MGRFSSGSVCVLFPCYSFLFILIEAIKTVLKDPGLRKKEIILFLFSSIIEYNDPADWPQFLSPPQVLFSSVSITKAGQKRTLCCYLLKVKTYPDSPLSYWEHVIPTPWKYLLWSLHMTWIISRSAYASLKWCDVRPCPRSNWTVLSNLPINQNSCF